MREVRKGVFELRAYAGVNPATKKKRFESRRVKAPNRRAAQRLANTFQQEVDAARLQPEDETFGTYLDRWLADKKMDLAPASWTNYESVVRRWLKPRLGSVPLRRLTNRQLEGVYREAQNSGLKKSSAKKIHVVASSALGDALRWDLIERNPAATARSPADTPQETCIMTTDEIGRMLAHAASDPAQFLRASSRVGIPEQAVP